MSQRHELRLGAATASSGGILTLVGNILHPREPGQLDSAANLLGVVLRNEMWAGDHFVLAIGLALLLHGFYGLTRSIRSEPGAAWARFAWHMAIVGVIFGIALMLTEAVAVTSIARAWDSRTGARKGPAPRGRQCRVRAVPDLFRRGNALPLRCDPGALWYRHAA